MEQLHEGDTWGSADGNAPLSPFVPQGVICHPESRLWPLLSVHDCVGDLRLIFIYCHICLFLQQQLGPYGWCIRTAAIAKHSCCVGGWLSEISTHTHTHVVWQNWDDIQEIVSSNPKMGDPLRITTVPFKWDFIWRLFEQLIMSSGLADPSYLIFLIWAWKNSL